MELTESFIFMIEYSKREYMKVHSTKSLEKIEISQAILNGLAKDGGLYVWDDLNPSFLMTLFSS